MDIKHKPGGDMRIFLDSQDRNFLKAYGYCIDSNGDSKTLIRYDEARDTVSAELGNADVTVYLPNGVDDLPVRIAQPDIQVVGNDEVQLRHYFGEIGGIVVQFA